MNGAGDAGDEGDAVNVCGLREALAVDGFSLVPRAAGEEVLAALERALEDVAAGAGVRRRGAVYAIRNLLEVAPAVREFAASRAARELVVPVLGENCFAARGIFFDKNRDAPWKVAWHQDLSIAVREKMDAEGFGPWSVKAGVVHVQPPAAVLEGMLTLRLHLDDCDETNGALRVLPGSHRAGRLGAEEIERRRRDLSPVTCSVARGGALLMRPLLLHSSAAPRGPRRRRVIHLEFAAASLPCGLLWPASGGG